MMLAALLMAVGVFILVLRLTRATVLARRAVTTAGDAAKVMRAPELSDAEKEARTRRAAGALFVSFLGIAGIAALALALSLLVVWAGSALNLYAFDRALDVAAGWPFIIGASVAGTLGWYGLTRLSGTQS